MRTLTLVNALRETVRKYFPQMPQATDYELGHSLGQIWWWYGEKVFTRKAHERMAFLGLDGEPFVELGKGYRDGFFMNLRRSTREEYEVAEGSTLRRLIRKQAYARFPDTHVGLRESRGLVAVFPPPSVQSEAH